MKLLLNLTLGTLLLTSFANVAQAQYVGQDDQQEIQGTDPEFGAWCTNSVRTLERAQRQAAGLIASDQFNAAAQTLLGALQNGVARPAWNIKPVTYRLMTHGALVGRAMLSAAGSDIRGIKATVNSLEGMYDLILESAQEIDRQYYRVRGGYSRSRGVREFDIRIQRMVGDMLALVNGHMTYSRGGQVFPLGPAKAYLVGAGMFADSSATELSQLVFAESLGCEIVELDELAADLRAFNSSNAPQSQQIGMFYDTYDRLDGVITELRAGRGCP